MGELASIADVIQKYGRDALDAILLVAVVMLYRQMRSLEAARLTDAVNYGNKITEIAVKSIEADKDNQHAIALFAKSLESRTHV